jgi:hypothetical protein
MTLARVRQAPNLPTSGPPKRRNLTATATFFAALALSPATAYPQGCSQCRDNTAATPPATQAAYRHAILLMVFTAGGLFLGTLSFFKGQR